MHKVTLMMKIIRTKYVKIKDTYQRISNMITKLLKVKYSVFYLQSKLNF